MLAAEIRRGVRERLSTNRREKETVIPTQLFDHILSSALVGVAVDEQWYLNHNPDVRAAVEAGQSTSGRQHFIERGYFEDRLPFRIEIDTEYYLESNPDIREAYERGEIRSLQTHFDETGCREGRHPYRGFSLFRSALERIPA